MGRRRSTSTDVVSAAPSEGGKMTGYLKGALKPHVPPWLAAAGLGITAPLASLKWEGSTGASIGLTVASIGLTGFTYWAGENTSRQRQLHSAITVAAGSAWFTGCTIAGYDAAAVDDTYLMGILPLTLSWNIRKMLRINDTDTAATAGEDGAKSLMEKIGMAKAKLRTIRTEPNRVTVPYAIEPGEGTNEQGSRAAGNLAGAAGVPVTAVRHQPDPDNASRGQWVITPVDVLRETTWYPGPSAPGGSIAEPLVVGLYDDGEDLAIQILKALHILIMGMTGSGKTEAALDVFAEIFSRKDVGVWLSDHVKQGQDLAPLFPACDWVALTLADTEAMVEALRSAIPARTKWLGQHNYRSWEPAAAEQQNDPEHTCRTDGTACGCPGIEFLFGWFEEAANTLAKLDDDVFTTIAQEARSAGVALVVSMQRASGYQISTDTRSSIPSVLCFGVRDDTDAGFALSDEVLSMGAAPQAWKNRRPGYCILEAAGVDEDRFANPARTFRNDTPIVEQVVIAYAHLRMPVSQVTAQAAITAVGNAYIKRTRHPMPGAPDTEGTQRMTTTHEPAAGLDEHDGYDPTVFTDEEDAEFNHIDPEQELPETESGDEQPIFGSDTGRKPVGEEARQLLRQALREFEANGQMIVGPKDFVDWMATHNLSRSWVSKALLAAYHEGLLEETSAAGRWRIVPQLQAA